jgi:hypothetical protein
MASTEKSPKVDLGKLEVAEVSQVNALTAEAVVRESVSPQLKRLKRWGLSRSARKKMGGDDSRCA